jgi:hypothetical protein
MIVNPYAAEDQGLFAPETLYVSFVGPATLQATATTIAVQPGGVLRVPSDDTTSVWVNAATSGHRFSAFVVQEPSSFTPVPSLFPPSGPTGLLRITPSYLYQEYQDDLGCQAFVDAYNVLAQSYLDWFNAIELPVYTNSLITGALLDFVALGLYGLERPALPSGKNQNIGTLNTFHFNQIAMNTLKVVGNQDFYATTDDIFKRILTWQFFKGDGKVFNVRWLKRRIMRFLFGTNGTSYNVDQTYTVSVSFGAGNQVNIDIGLGTRRITGGALLNKFALNRTRTNELDTTFTPSPAIPTAIILKAAIESGAVELPFQFTYVVNVA